MTPEWGIERLEHTSLARSPTAPGRREIRLWNLSDAPRRFAARPTKGRRLAGAEDG